MLSIWTSLKFCCLVKSLTTTNALDLGVSMKDWFFFFSYQSDFFVSILYKKNLYRFFTKFFYEKNQ